MRNVSRSFFLPLFIGALVGAMTSGCAANDVASPEMTEAMLVEGEKAPAAGEPSEAVISDDDAAEADAFWTDERIAAATPLDDPRDAVSEARPRVSGSFFAGIPTVGAIFSSNGAGTHFCSASVVTSNNRSLIITAAHCIHGGAGKGYGKHLAFVPKFDGQKPTTASARPYGTWIARSALVDARWASHTDADLDFGFVTLAPLGGRKIQDVVGSNRLAINRGFVNTVEVIGYPDSSKRAIQCQNVTSAVSGHRYQMRFDCGGYTNGTSGSPWLMNFNGHTGDVIGVLGGYEHGGNTPEVSYAAYFDHDVEALHTRADH